VKKLISMLIIIGFSLTQTACMRCCVTTDLIKRIDDESKQPPKVVRYVDRVDKVISAYINDEEDELTICVEGKLAEKTMTQQFALKTSLNVEQLKNQPPKGITYQAGNIPTIQMERHTVISSCPEQPTNARTLMAKNINFDKENVSSNQSHMETTIEGKLAALHLINDEKIHDFRTKNPEKFRYIVPGSSSEFVKLLQPIYEKSDSVFYVSIEKPYPSQYLTYTNYPPLVAQIGGFSPIAQPAAPPINKDSPPPENQTVYVYQEEPLTYVYNPEKFDGKHFVVFKIKEEKKIIQNHFSMNYLALPLTIVADVLLSPFYLLEIILCPPQGCRLVI
jgi:hypothetical protein